MKIPKIKLKNLSKIHVKKREFKNLSSRAAYDWKIMLAVFLILVIFLIVFHSTLFFRIDEGEAFSSSQKQEKKKPLISISALEETVRHFEERSADLELLRSGGRRSTDPSF
jgi:hypothetical protein